MKRTVNINLGGFPFTADEDAYQVLHNYLTTIEHHFSKTEGCEDIICDIENRICELFQERVKKSPILTMKDMEDVMATMGTPEDFGAEPMIPSNHTAAKEPLLRPGKKLFRDPENKVLGGVISGLAAYLGFHNITALRLLCLFAAISGIGVIAYLVFWAVVPEARSSSDKLAMKGEPINVENIAKTIREEFEDLSEQFNKFGKSWENGKRTRNTKEQKL